MATLGFSRDNPFVLSGGPFTPAQREQVERQYVATTYTHPGLPASVAPEWKWVETRTFPDNGHTYDVVSAVILVGDVRDTNELWFDVTNTLTPAEKGPLVVRAITAPTVKPSAGAIRPAGQADSSSTGLVATLFILGALAGFTVLEYYSRPSPRQLSPVRRRRRKSVMLPV